MHRGSRKHVLDWTEQDGFPSQLVDLVSPCPVEIRDDARWMPRGPGKPAEARLETFGPKWLPGHPAWQAIMEWWLVHRIGANTPNRDIAVGCTIAGRPGLVLVEAKANHPELRCAGKRLPKNASKRSRENHEQIGLAIATANVGWREIDSRVQISRDSHYQSANRLAFAWKLGTLGIPVVLVFLGFTGDEGIGNVGKPFPDGESWDRAFLDHIRESFPAGLLEGRIDLGHSPVWVLSRSRPVIEASSRK